MYAVIHARDDGSMVVLFAWVSNLSLRDAHFGFSSIKERGDVMSKVNRKLISSAVEMIVKDEKCQEKTP